MSEELSSSFRRGQRLPSSLRLLSDVLVSSTMLSDVKLGQWRAIDRTVPSPVAARDLDHGHGERGTGSKGSTGNTH